MTDVDGAAVAVLTPRAQRTRAALLASARKVFERDGFHNARITDIADGAKVAHGTFYTYFDSKETIFLALVDDMIADLFHENEDPGTARQQSGLEPIERLERSNREYLKVYRDNGRLIALWEELATHHEGAKARLDQGLQKYVERSERQIVRLQAEGRADRELDPHYAARALTGMVYRFAYSWFGQGHDYDLDKAVDSLTRLWANALRMDQD
ncbi:MULTISPECIES: TetR/AcrR family transcriptional regulator [unclassified Nocardioides]|uniref:TetR/AcrR family transcriptional regulator n=1 Tax=unclassified Nocardioides TaxID=2615069 RepID=UPI000056FBE2|nr:MULTISPECIES: TetR/AcrR family transcriptional regulator [unclassified Nocardioides]ABL83608.1 transcriptional regulator, TetR family [Nocardioides sp. JS614]MBI2242408.1 TetR/AcrR family transcriptional regulator [Nocardioides sp.]